MALEWPSKTALSLLLHTARTPAPAVNAVGTCYLFGVFPVIPYKPELKATKIPEEKV